MTKTLIFHDTFLMKGGAERMNIEIAKSLNADIATAIWSPDCYDARSMGFTWKIIQTCPNFRKWMIGFIKMKWSFFRSTHILPQYDTIIFSNEAISGIWKIKPETKTFYYAHSISRHLFDQKDDYMRKVNVFIRPFFSIFTSILRYIYIKEISKIGTIFVNSKANQNRVRDWLKREDSIVIYPSVDTEKFNIFEKKLISQIIAIEWINWSYKDYYLSFSRLTHAKRVDTIIRAFQKMPEKKVVILYGENDSQKDEFIELWGWYSNIIFHKLKDNNNLPYIIWWSIATICISKNEDFWMVTIESMACGTPVIAVDEWGYQESMMAGKTGYLLETSNLEEKIAQTITSTDNTSLISMKDSCRERAMDFSKENMLDAINKYIHSK